MQARILLVSPSFPPTPGGIERTAGALAEMMPDARVRVVAGRPRKDHTAMATPALPVRWSDNVPPGGRQATFALNRVALGVGLSQRPDVVIAVHIRAAPAARALARLVGSRTLTIVHAKEMRQYPALAESAMRWADGVVAVSGHARGLALTAGAPATRIRLIHPGVTLPSHAPPRRRADAPPTIVTVARMADEHKGHRVALHALAILRRDIPDVRWTMVGDGPLRADLEREAAELDVADAVHFCGTVPDERLAEILWSARVFCLLNQAPSPASGGEGFGIVFTEAGAHGLPVVGTRVPGVIDAVEEDRTGCLVAPEDPRAAAAALAGLLRNSAKAESMGAAGRERARQLAWPHVVARYRRAVDDILTAPRRRNGAPPRWLGDLARAPRSTSPERLSRRPGST